MTTGSSAVYHQDDKRSSCWLLTSVPTPICLCKPFFSCKACPGNFPGHALHEKGLQRQMGVGPLVSSQERKALMAPVVNRLSNGDFVPPSVLSTISLVRAPEESLRTVFSICWGARGRVVSWPDRPNGVQCYPAPPLSPPRRAPPRPERPVVCPGIGLNNSLTELLGAEDPLGVKSSLA